MAFPSVSTWSRIAAVAWTLLILAACSLPGRSLPSTTLIAFDKAAHALMFAGFGLLWMHTLSHPLWARARWVLLAGLLYAIGTEGYQGLLPFERTPDSLDVLANMAGLLLAVGGYVLWRRFRA